VNPPNYNGWRKPTPVSQKKKEVIWKREEYKKSNNLGHRAQILWGKTIRRLREPKRKGPGTVDLAD